VGGARKKGKMAGGKKPGKEARGTKPIGHLKNRKGEKCREIGGNVGTNP